MSQTSTTAMPAATAENYQLKWHSHVSNLNSSVSSLYKNDKYADVMLFTCNSEDGCHRIPAHKLILGTCSHYFSTIFDNNPAPINSTIYIVLPPDLSKQATLILIQYMYTGEATVSNDILTEVLKGGELLKIRGLCKVQSNSENVPPSQPFRVLENGQVSNKSTPRNSVDKKQLPDSRTVLTQQKSPVIVMTSTPAQSFSQPQNFNQIKIPQPQQKTPQPSTIIVKKDVAIDPAERAIPIEHYGLVSLQIAAAVQERQNNINNMNMKKNQTIDQRSITPSKSFQDETPTNERSRTPSPVAFKIYNQQNLTEQEEEILRYTEKKKRVVQNSQQQAESSQVRTKTPSNKYIKAENGHPSKPPPPLPRQKDLTFPDALSFLAIKEEPLESPEYEVGAELVTQSEIITIKPEHLELNEDSMDSEGERTYAPLTCEICNWVFQLPADFVRHIESHSELSAQNIPKKRRRLEEEETENIAALSCDLCENINFATPGDWVRHVQNMHTETELAMSNNSILPKKSCSKPSKEGHFEKNCTVCNKTFPSYASMLIHKRSHTGETPFFCSLCNKGFNVKSNLLRHMRTLHQINAPNDNQEDTDSNSLD